ncbi:MAG: PIN domain nuclease [Deltaproteobacteria bacterium]|nr:PIN domain nuclease [Deltaproteobacteria bacterium]
MVLVDASVLIDYLKGNDNPAVHKFQSILDGGIPYGINSFIYQELLQGVRTEKGFYELKEYLDTQRFYGLKHPRSSFAEAALIYFNCSKKGLTVSSAIDFIVDQTAVENNLLLLHNDTDFEMIATVVELKFF